MSEIETLVEAAKRGTLGEVISIVANHPELVNERDAAGGAIRREATAG